MVNACLRLSSGNREDKMEIKTRLSMPSTTSSRIRVPNPPQAVGSATHENRETYTLLPQNMENAVAIEQKGLDQSGRSNRRRRTGTSVTRNPSTGEYGNG